MKQHDNPHWSEHLFAGLESMKDEDHARAALWGRLDQSEWGPELIANALPNLEGLELPESGPRLA